MADLESASLHGPDPDNKVQLNDQTSTMNWTMTFSSKAAPPAASCSRKLAPPASRETVVRQFGNLSGWRKVDQDGELWVAGWSKKRDHGDFRASSVAPPAATDTLKQSATPEHEHFEAIPKRRRLNLAPVAESIAEEVQHLAPKKNEGSTPSPSSLDDKLTAPPGLKTTVFDDDSDDEGYHTSSVASPKSAGSPHADDDSLATRFAAFHGRMPTMHVPSEQADDRTEHRAKDTEQIQVEEQAARRSEHLRGRATRRTAGLNGEPGLFSDTQSDSEAVARAEQSKSLSFRDTVKSVSAASAFPPQTRSEHEKSSFTTSTNARRADFNSRPPQQPVRRSSFVPKWQTAPPPRYPYSSGVDATGVFNPVAKLKPGLRREGIPISTARPPKRVRFGDTIHHSASRQAAERWRTQERHSEYNTETTRAATNADYEQRLRNIQNGHSKIILEPELPEIWPNEFTGLDLEYKDQELPAPILLGPKQPKQHTASPPTASMAESDLQEADQTGFDNRVTHHAPDYSKEAQGRPSVIDRSVTMGLDANDQFSHLPLGEIADDVDITNDKAFKEERARLRELKSFLKVVEETFEQMARVWAVRAFNESEAVMLDDAVRTIIPVLDRHKTSQLLRQVLVRVRDSFKKKADAKLEFAGIPLTELKAAYIELLTASRANKLEEAQVRTAKSILELEAAQQSHKHTLKEQKDAARQDERAAQRAEQDAERGTKRARQAQQPKKPKLSKTEQQLADLRRLNDEFEAQKHASQDQTVEAQAQVVDQDSASEISEEDAEGTGYVNGGFTSAPTPRSGMLAQPAYDGTETVGLIVEDNDLDEINTLEDERQRERESSHPRGGGQAFDEKLILEMKLASLKRKQQVHFDDLAEVIDDDAIEVEYDEDEYDSQTDSDSESDNDYDEQVFRYAVRGVFRGLPDLYQDGDEYGFQAYFCRERAEAEMLRIIKSLHRKWSAEHGNVNLSSTFTPSGIIEQKLKADSKNCYARVWLEEQLVSRAKVESRLAKKMAMADGKLAWYVDWEKTITTTTTTPAGANISTDDDGDDVFGNSTPEPDRVQVESRVERPGIEDVQMLTNSLQANQLAKDNYMAWFAGFAPPHERPSFRYPNYYGSLKIVHDELKQEVESALDGVGVGPWEEELERKLPNDGIQENGVKVSVREKYTVVVRRKRLLGAPN